MRFCADGISRGCIGKIPPAFRVRERLKMKNNKMPLTPVLLGGDLNAYSMAMSFASAYGVPSYVFSRSRLAITDSSSYIKLNVVNGLDGCDGAVEALTEFAKEHSGEKLILVPCADWYMEMLEYARDVLHGHYFFNIPSFEVWRTTSDKASFMRMLDRYGIEHPKTEIYGENVGTFATRAGKLRPPFVIKPSDSSEYWRHPFKGMKKVYFADTLAEAEQIYEKIFRSGYGGKVLLQEYIGNRGGAKSPSASVLTTYSGADGKVISAVMGDVLLEELSPSGRGNYSAIVTRPLDSMANKLITMLDGIGYTGIANFDILRADGKSYCLELNPRQGRSFDYVRSAGVNLARLLTEEAEGKTHSQILVYPEGVWRCVSRRTVRKYASDKDLAQRAEILEKEGRCYTPYDYRSEEGWRRKIYVAAHLYRQSKMYKRYGKEARTCY